MKHNYNVENAPKFADWILKRGGVALWRSVDLSNPGASWSTPARTVDGQPTPKPTWQAADEPEVITDPQEIEVYEVFEIKRFHVGTQRSSGLSWSVTSAGSRRIRAEVKKAGKGAFYRFDYADDKNCVIMGSRSLGTLKEWMKNNKEKLT